MGGQLSNLSNPIGARRDGLYLSKRRPCLALDEIICLCVGCGFCCCCGRATARLSRRTRSSASISASLLSTPTRTELACRSRSARACVSASSLCAWGMLPLGIWVVEDVLKKPPLCCGVHVYTKATKIVRGSEVQGSAACCQSPTMQI